MLLTLAMLAGCSTTKEAENDVQDELGDFRNWVNTTTGSVADKTEEDWQQAKEDFKMRTQELDQKQEHFSGEVKQDYQHLKQQFTEADEMYQSSHMEAQKVEWQRNLLGTYADLSTINETNVREAYITFMDNVREQRKNWTDKEWEMAKVVLNSLDERRKAITADIPTDSQIKIKALQMEFHTLETGADASDND